MNEGLIKRYNAKDRNQGRDNLLVIGSANEKANSDEQIVHKALEKVLTPARVEWVGSGEGPPDIIVDGEIGVEVRGHFPTEGEAIKGQNVQKAVKKKAKSLRQAWWNEPEGRGRRLRRCRECWIAVTVPMPILLIKFDLYTDSMWQELLKQESKRWGELLSECTAHSQDNPRISRIAILFRAAMAGFPLLVYNTNAYKAGVCREFETLPRKGGETKIIEDALPWRGMHLQFGKEVIARDKHGRPIKITNEAKMLVGDAPETSKG